MSAEEGSRSSGLLHAASTTDAQSRAVARLPLVRASLPERRVTG
jgi:hypothetical protein